MSGGRRSDRALAAAEQVARMRGEVMFLMQRPGSCFDFLVSGPTGTSAIRAERALRIHGSPAEIAVTHAAPIARISAATLAPGISRELWFWSPWGTMRYFRVDGTSLIELDMLGVVRAPLVKGALAGAVRPRWRKSRRKSGGPDPLPGPGPGQSPGTGFHHQKPGTPGPSLAPAGSSDREPAPVRYLRRRAREKGQAGNPAGGTGPTA
ncbi:hypothetical protein [Methanoregula sp.]|uniref:hypothetical protein n=1 Tax=Methanoregula sp. TaxID=2052170 RepID=UPI003C78CEBF